MSSIIDQLTELYVFVDDFLTAHPNLADGRQSPHDRPEFADAEVDFFDDLVKGVDARREELDALIAARLAEDWSLARLDKPMLQQGYEFRDIIIKSSNGNFVRLSDVADIEDSVRNARSFAWFNKQPAVLIQITKQGDANVIDTVDRVKALIPISTRGVSSLESLSRVKGVGVSALIDVRL